MTEQRRGTSRRQFLQRTAAVAAATIVPRHVLGGPNVTPPSESLGGALIGCGGRGPGTFQGWAQRSAWSPAAT